MSARRPGPAPRRGAGGARGARPSAARSARAPRAARRATRAPSSGEVAPDPARTAAGWQFRFAADRARAEETLRLYRDLGFEVAADPIVPENLSPDCGDCRLVAALGFQLIYTRRPGTAGATTPAAARGRERKGEADE